MNKKYMLLAIPILGLFLMCSVMASDFSITGDRNTQVTLYTERISFDAWHSDGRAVELNPVTNKWSRGLEPQGKGSFMYSYDLNNSYGDYRKVINLKLKEVSSSEFGNWVYSSNKATGTYWIKGSMPLQLKDIVFNYRYNKLTKIVYISTPYLNTNLIVNNK